MSTEKLNIYQKLLAIQKHVIGLKKDGNGGKFDYVTGNKVLDHIRPEMDKHGLLLKQEIISIENTRQDYATRNGALSEINSKVMMKFTWIDADSGQKEECLFGANGQNAWDKGVGSALTYGERYFLLKFFHIATDEDDIDNPELKKDNPIAQPAPEPEVLLITDEQKTEIRNLLNNPNITSQEETKMLLSIDSLTFDRAKKSIETLKKTIKEREAKKPQL